MNKTINKKDLYNIPNMLGYFRILLVPFFLYTYLNASEPNQYYLAAFIVLFAGFTDMADGYIARKYNMITDWGKLIDPVADKLMHLAVVVGLLIRVEGILFFFLLYFAKETYMFMATLILYRKKTHIDGAKWYGKLCTVVLDISMVIMIAIPNLNRNVFLSLLWICAVFMIFSIFMYLNEFIKVYAVAKK